MAASPSPFVRGMARHRAAAGKRPDAGGRETRPGATLAVAHQDDRGHGGNREIALAAREFFDRIAGARRRHRKAHFGEDFVGGEHVVRATGRTPRPRWCAPPCGPRTTTAPSSACNTIGISAAGSACAIEPPIVPRVRVGRCPTSVHGVAEQRQLVGDERAKIRAHAAASSRRMRRVAVGLDVVEPRNPVEIDDGSRRREPKIHHRDKALTAGEHPRVGAL